MVFKPCGAFVDIVRRVCVCVCMFLYLLHSEDQSIHFTSKARTRLLSEDIVSGDLKGWFER